MHLSEFQKIVINGVTAISWTMGILISLAVVARGRRLKEEKRGFVGIYILLVGTTEVFYTVGAVMILSAMGVNVMHHLAGLRFWKFYEITGKFDLTTVKMIGMLGWTGFVINRSVSFVSPGYLLIRGGKSLPGYFYYAAWTEIGLETLLTLLIFISLLTG